MKLKDVVNNYLKLYFPKKYSSKRYSIGDSDVTCNFITLKSCNGIRCDTCTDNFNNIEINLNEIESNKITKTNLTNLDVYNALTHIFLEKAVLNNLSLNIEKCKIDHNKCPSIFLRPDDCVHAKCKDCQTWWDEKYEIPEELKND